MALVQTEIARVTARRLFRWITILALVGMIVAGVVVYFSSDEQSTNRDPFAEQLVRDCIRDFEEAEQRGHSVPLAPGGDPEEFCREIVAPPVGFRYTDLEEMLPAGLGIPFIMLGWLIGASAMGAEWVSRSLTQTLTWEPRRGLLLGAKTLAAAVVIFVWACTLALFFAIVLLPAGIKTETISAANASWWADYAVAAARTAALTALGSALGLWLATIGRNTAAALGVGFAYLAIVESLIRGLRPQWSEWLLGDNLALVLVGGEELPGFAHGVSGAVGVLLMYALIVALAAFAIFSRREVA